MRRSGAARGAVAAAVRRGALGADLDARAVCEDEAQSARLRRLAIRVDGQVYANVNQPLLKRIDEQTPHEILLRELTGGRSWLRTRDQVCLCKDCLNDALCPPLSSHACALGRNDLCDFGIGGIGGRNAQPDNLE